MIVQSRHPTFSPLRWWGWFLCDYYAYDATETVTVTDTMKNYEKHQRSGSPFGRFNQKLKSWRCRVWLGEKNGSSVTLSWTLVPIPLCNLRGLSKVQRTWSKEMSRDHEEMNIIAKPLRFHARSLLWRHDNCARKGTSEHIKKHCQVIAFPCGELVFARTIHGGTQISPTMPWLLRLSVLFQWPVCIKLRQSYVHVHHPFLVDRIASGILV